MLPDDELNPRLPVQIGRNRRLLAVDPAEQYRLDDAIGRAVVEPRKAALVRLSNRAGERFFLQLVPLSGRAREVFSASVTLGVLQCPTTDQRPPATAPLLLREAFNLTDREARIAAMISEGVQVSDIAWQLRIGIGTVRNHIKSIYEKTATTRLPELAALLGRLRG